MRNSWVFNLSWKESPRRQNSSILDMESFRGTSLEPSFCEAPEIQIGIGLCRRKLEAVKAKWRNSVREKGRQGSSWGRSSQKSKHGVLIGKFQDWEKRGWNRLGWRSSHFSFGSSMSCLMMFAFPWNTPELFHFNKVSGMSFGVKRVTWDTGGYVLTVMSLQTVSMVPVLIVTPVF